MKKTKIMHGVFAFVGFFVGTTFMAITMHYQCEGEVNALKGVYHEEYLKSLAKPSKSWDLAVVISYQR